MYILATVDICGGISCLGRKDRIGLCVAWYHHIGATYHRHALCPVFPFIPVAGVLSHVFRQLWLPPGLGGVDGELLPSWREKRVVWQCHL